MKIKTKDITVCAVAVALMFILAWLPVAAFMIPVIFVTCLYRPKHGLIVGIFAGCMCLAVALIVGAGNDSPGMVALVCAVWVIPRALAGWFSAYAFAAAKRVVKGEGRMARMLPYNAAVTAGVLTNTVLIVSCLALWFPELVILGVKAGEGWWVLMLIGLAELMVLNLIMPPLCITVAKALKIGEFAPSRRAQAHNAQCTTHSAQ